MALDFVTGEEDVLARIKEIPNIDVFSGDYTPDTFTPQTDANKLFRPYVLVKFNGAFQAAQRGIVGWAHDTFRQSFTVYVVSPADNVTRQLRDQIRQKLLIDFNPTDGGPINPAGGLSFMDSDLGYARYIHATNYNYLSNLGG